MHGLSPVDPGNIIDWGQTSQDFALYRPGPPNSFYEKLEVFNVGFPGQRVLDLGTGTGVVARKFAEMGCSVTGVDISEQQIKIARVLTNDAGLSVDYHVAPAEKTGLPEAKFDVIIANQCWLYFNPDKIIEEVHRMLAPGGVLVTSHFSWLPKLDPLARAAESLILHFNPNWTAGGWDGEIPPMPKWAEQSFTLKAMFWYDEAVHFTRESWRGRIRACRGVGAALTKDEVMKFDWAHEKLLKEIAPESFTILHRIDAHIFKPKYSF